MEVTLVQNIESNADLGLDSIPYNFINVGGSLFFQTSYVNENSSFGSALWQSDGTPEGTYPVLSGSDIFIDWTLTSVEETLFFQGRDNAHGGELWSSDGTTEGSGLVLDIDTGEFDQPNSDFTGTVTVGNSSNPLLLTDVDGTLFFVADDGMNGGELWTSDGTAVGTNLVLPMVVTEENGNIKNIDSRIANLINFQGKAFFTARDGRRGEELWMSDGTAEGTQLVRDINPSASSSPEDLTIINGTLYFTADNGINGRELWKTDGTFAGTELVRDIDLGENGIEGEDFNFDFSDEPFAHQIVDGEDAFLFLADDGIHGEELWVSDGTETSTNLVLDINPGEDSSFSRTISFSGAVVSYDPKLTNVDGTLFFVADDGVHGRELWTSDGTVEGTGMVKDIIKGAASSFGEDSPSNRQSQLIDANGTLFFTIGDSDQSELWKSDGTSEGTELVATGGNILNWDLAVVDNNLFFTGEGINGASEDASQLWKIELNSL